MLNYLSRNNIGLAPKLLFKATEVDAKRWVEEINKKS